MRITGTLLLLLAAGLIRAGPDRAYADEPVAGRHGSSEEWRQLKYDCRHSGDVPQRNLHTPLGLIGAVPLTDAILTSPVVAGGRIYAVDASGVAFCIERDTLKVIWRTATGGGKSNCNNVSSPALAAGYLHFGTMAGAYYVLDAATGRVVRRIACGEPILSAPVVAGDRVYFATLGTRVCAVSFDGTPSWTWDFLKEVVGFSGNRWSGADWAKFKQGRVSWRDQFCCWTDIAAMGKTIVVPAAGRTIWLEDRGAKPQLRAVGLVPECAGDEFAPIFGLSIGPRGAAYVQWHRRDNTGRTECMQLADGRVRTAPLPGTQTAINLHGLLSFCSASVRGDDVYRCRPEASFSFTRHSPGLAQPQSLGGYPSICPPILLGDVGVYGGLDGSLYVVPLSGGGKAWSFQTAFGKAISAPVAVCDGRVYFGCEDGYLYVLAPGGKAALPTQDLGLWKIRSPLSSKLADAKYDWFTNYGNWANTNANDQNVRPPVKIKWVRRYEGTFKHLPVCGGGRVYLHTAEGQILAVEEETGRLLWRRYFPNTYLSFTSPLYYRGRLLVPQAGMRQSMLRCFDAATGKLLWEAPFTGSPSWSRQQPPVVHENLAIYMFGSGKYAAQGSARALVFQGEPQPSPDGSEIMSWIYTHDNPYYPRDNHPLVRAWDLATGHEVWTRDFSEFGSGGNDAGLCLMNGAVYYSTFFGYAARHGKPGATGLTAALEPRTGKVLWTNTQYSVTAGCTISGKDGRLYLGGYNRSRPQTENRHVRCLDARDGSLVWESEPLPAAVNVVSVGNKYLFANASWKDCCLLDRDTGKIVSRFNYGYACTRFTLSEPYVMGSNMDLVDLAGGNRVVSSGPAVDSRECVGSVVSNGRIFYAAQASGLQLSLVYGEEAAATPSPW
jgi:outer membrane protein assembly factor BamB